MKNGWEVRLNRAVEAAMGAPFEYGEHDCCTFAADCVEAMTGVDHLKGFRGRYHDKKSAVALLRRSGVIPRLRAKFGPGVPRAAAKRGFVVVSMGKQGATVGMCLGRYSAYAGLDGGVVFEETELAVKAFDPCQAKY